MIALDELLTGLDAHATRHIKDLLPERLGAGVTMIFTSHILEVVQRSAQLIGITNHGKLMAEGSLE